MSLIKYAVLLLMILGDDMGTPRHSLQQIVADPQAFHGKSVVVSGVLSFEFEKKAIFTTKKDAIDLNMDKGIWLLSDNSVFKKYHGRRVTVAGTFDSTLHGHGWYPGAITNIVRLVPGK